MEWSGALKLAPSWPVGFDFAVDGNQRTRNWLGHQEGPCARPNTNHNCKVCSFFISRTLQKYNKPEGNFHYVNDKEYCRASA